VRTDELVTLLASGTAAIDPKATRHRSWVALGSGMLVAFALMVAWLEINPGLRQLSSEPRFWLREAFCALLAAGALVAVARLGRPGATLRGGVKALLAVPIAAMLVLGAALLLAADAHTRPALLAGVSWTVCSASIALLSVPVFITMVWWLRGLAPTRLRAAGAAAGFAAGTTAALVYTLHCPEIEPPFLAVWYVLGMAIPAALGAWLGPRLLRW
jgi:hypothetical protein